MRDRMQIVGQPDEHVRLTHRRRRTARAGLAYARAMFHEFRWTLLLLLIAMVFGAAVIGLTPGVLIADRRPTVGTSLYGAWMAMLGQAPGPPPEGAWHLMLLYGLYPPLGFILIGEGIVRLAILMVSRRQGQKEWMKVMASTYRDHVILCGLGRLGVRVLEELVAAGQDVVVLERRRANRFIERAKALGAPVLIRDMKEDASLIDAGVAHAAAVVIATNDDIANLEVAIDARRLNPKIRVVMGLFDQQLAAKITDALDVDVAFSASALAAPLVAALSRRSKVLSTTIIAGVSHVAFEVAVEERSRLADKRVDEVEATYRGRVLALTRRAGATESPPSAASLVRGGDALIFHTASDQLGAIAQAAKPAGVGTLATARSS